MLTVLVGLTMLVLRGAAASIVSLALPPPAEVTGRWLKDAALALRYSGFAQALPSVGGGEALARAAHEIAPPRVPTLRRASSPDRAVFASRDNARDISVHPPRANRGPDIVGRLTAGWPGTASGHTRVGARFAVARAGLCCRPRAVSGGARGLDRCGTDPSSIVRGRDAARQPRVPPCALRHAGAHHRYHGRCDDPRHRSRAQATWRGWLTRMPLVSPEP